MPFHYCWQKQIQNRDGGIIVQSFNKLLLRKIIHRIIERDQEEWPPGSLGIYFQLKRPVKNPVRDTDYVNDKSALKENN